ncbi:MAG: hypothetical protein GY798_07625, partial [Hyphomicrobiales bacterium]|nr:hypothetical protein [Hyphomicrobiales bacterium]
GAVQIPAHRWYDHGAEWIGCTSLGPIPGYRTVGPAASKVWACPDHSWRADSNYLPFLRNAHLMAGRWTVSETEAHGEEIGRALAALNVTMNLAPVLGVSDGTAKTSFLGDRTFSDNPDRVVRWAGAFSKGIRTGSDGRVVTVVKHFPGLGSVLANTDDGPAHSLPLAELVTRDLLPYQGSIAADYGASAVMMSNVAVPGLTCPGNDSSCGVPATLSPAAYQLLRQRYGWNGLIMTDTLQTAAVLRRGRDISAAAVAAIAAGADMVMIKPDIDVRLSDYRDLLGQVRDALIAWVAEDPPTRRARLG